MDKIVVSVKDLAQKVKELTNNKMEYVKVSICEPLYDEDDIIPACLSFMAWTEEESFMEIDFDSIDAIDDPDSE